MKRFIIRSVRKSSSIASKSLEKSLNLSKRVENKTTRILDGTDYSVRLPHAEAVEKIIYNSLPYITPLHPALPSAGKGPTITLLLPSLDSKSFYGGTATALYVAGQFVKSYGNRRLRIVQTLKHGKPSGLSEFLKAAGINIADEDIEHVDVSGRRYNIYGYLSIHPQDIFIASAWWDAYLLSKLPLSNKFVYLVQDFEPIFYNNSDLSALSESTYHSDAFIPICNTKLMHDFMRNRSYPQFVKYNHYFEPAVSRQSSGLAIDNSGKKRKIFIYGRPDVHRNLFYSAIEAVNLALSSGELKGSEWECFMAGQDNLPDIQLSSGAIIQNLGKMQMSDYISFSKNIDIALAPMLAPHPNYPTLEFASIGSMVVTTSYENKVDLSRYSSNIILTPPSAEAMAEGVIQASKVSYSQRIDNQKANHINTSWQEALGSVVESVKKDIGQ